MRLIEKEMLEALQQGTSWRKDNTEVDSSGNVYLHGNHIATFDIHTGAIVVNKDTLWDWPTPTTKSRLRALGVDVYQKAGVIYLEGEEL